MVHLFEGYRKLRFKEIFDLVKNFKGVNFTGRLD